MKKSNKVFWITLGGIIALMLLALVTLQTVNDTKYSGGCLVSRFFAGENATGNGKIVSITTQVNAFNTINLSGQYEVSIQPSKENIVSMSVDENLAPYEKIVVSHGELSIGAEHNSISPSQPIKLVIQTSQPLHNIHLGGKTNLTMKNITTDALTLTLEGKSNATLQADVKNLQINLSGKSDLIAQVPQAESIKFNAAGNSSAQLTGVTKTLDISAAGKAEFNGKDLLANDADISSAGKSDIIIHAIKNLTISAAGATSVGYYGEPNINKSGFGQLSIEKLG